MAKKKDKGFAGMIGGGLMLGVGSAAIPRFGLPSRATADLSAAMILPTRFAPLGAMAHISKRITREMDMIKRRRR